jgi:uncharacterized membrane protein
VNIKIFIFTIINISLLVSGQLLWKLGIQQVGGVSYSVFFQLISSWYMWLGTIVYVVATIIWFKLLSMGNLSVVYPLQSLAYVFSILLAWIIFGENIPWTRWLGVAVLVLGVYLISLE